MSLSYTYEIRELRTQDENDHTDAVVWVHWALTATDENGTSGLYSSTTELTTANLTRGRFISFDQLKPEIVADWIDDLLKNDAERWEHINAVLLEQIQQKSIANNNRNVPWEVKPSQQLEPPAS